MMKETYPLFVTEWAMNESPVAVGRPSEILETIILPAPHRQGGRALLDALRDRRSSREFSDRPLSEQLLSDLLWCAFGVNRPDTHGRTAPSAQNWQEIAVHLATREGLYLFEPTPHALTCLSKNDVRATTGLQPHAATAPLTLIYVADFARAIDATEEEKSLYCMANAGFVAQNVYLFCASEGLATVVCGAIDRAALARALGLGPNQRVLLVQSAGYPAKLH